MIIFKRAENPPLNNSKNTTFKWKIEHLKSCMSFCILNTKNSLSLSPLFLAKWQCEWLQAPFKRLQPFWNKFIKNIMRKLNSVKFSCAHSAKVKERKSFILLTWLRSLNLKKSIISSKNQTKNKINWLLISLKITLQNNLLEKKNGSRQWRSFSINWISTKKPNKHQIKEFPKWQLWSLLIWSKNVKRKRIFKSW